MCEGDRHHKYTLDEMHIPAIFQCCEAPDPAKICRDGIVRAHDPNTDMTMDIPRNRAWRSMCSDPGEMDCSAEVYQLISGNGRAFHLHFHNSDSDGCDGHC